MFPTIEGDGAGRTPEERFKLLGHETRLGILWALWTAPDGAATFSEIQKRVGVRDNGRLNYHRGELSGRLIEPVPDGDGYRLRQAGREAVRAICAGTITADGTVETTPIDGTCADCGGRLTFRYVDGRAAVRCADCDRRVEEYPFPPGGLAGREPDEIAAAADQHERVRIDLAKRGVCPQCGGRMTAALVRGSPDYFDHPVHVRHECRRCAFHPRQSLGEAVLDHPEVVTFFYRRGIDLRERPRWTLDFCYDVGCVELLSEEPLRGAVDVRCDGNRLRVTFDADGTPCRFERPDE